MRMITVLHQLRVSQTVRHILSSLVLALLIVQWNALQHVESNLSGHDGDNCQVCLLGNHMASAMLSLPPFIPVVPAQTNLLIFTQSKFHSSPITSFLVRAPPHS
jgi:hypothetical protein